ncbi:MAG TPA: HAD-IA family hydrolase [Thermoleophilaceae bacterium]
MIRAVTIDALGTLVHMQPPGPRLRDQLRERAGVEVSEEQATAGFAAEIRYYLDHHLEGGDPESLDALRDRCAGVLRTALGIEDVELGVVREALLASLQFDPFDDAAPALERLQSAGLRVVAASNWDSSLPEVLARTGLAPLLDGVVSSAAAGAAKPDARLFEAALEIAGAPPADALHVGDRPDKDVQGALALGMRAVLIARDGEPPDGVEAPVIRTLAELPPLVLDA